MKKILIGLLMCFLTVSWGLTQSSESQKRTKELYRGSKDRPTMRIWFFDDPEQKTKGWMARMVVYEIYGQTRYVGGVEYLTEEQRQAEDTIIIELKHLFYPDDQRWPNKEVVSLSVCYPYGYNVKTGKLQSYHRVRISDTNLDGVPDDGAMDWFRDPYTEDYLLYEHEITKEDVSVFKLSKKQFNYKKIEKEFQEWLKENKQ